MLIFFIFLTSFTSGLNVSIINQTQPQLINVNMNVESQSYIERLDDLGKILSVKFIYQDSDLQFCTAYYQGVTIHQSPEGFVSLVHELNRKDIDELTEQELYQGYNEKTSAFATNDDGVCILSSKGTVYFIGNQNIKNISIYNTTLPNFDENQQSPQIVYDSKSLQFIVVLNDNIIKLQFLNGQFTSSAVTGWMKQPNQYKVVASDGWLYSAQGEQGLLIYEIKQHGLELTQAITALDLFDSGTETYKIVDVAVFKDSLYILDGIHGITVYGIKFNGTFVKNTKLGLIQYSDCISLAVKGSTVILIQNFKTSSQIVELYINNDEWMEMRRITTKSKLRKADIIDDNFAIIRGLHDHKIMLIKMSEQLLELEAKRLDNYFFSGNLIGVDKFGNNNETLFAISPHGFYLFVYRPYPSIIICNSNELESGLYNVSMAVKSTKCSDETQKELQYCLSNYQYVFDVKKPLLSAEQQQAYIYMAILLAAIAGALLLCLLYHFRRYQLQKENINFHIQRSKKKRSEIKVEQ